VGLCGVRQEMEKFLEVYGKRAVEVWDKGLIVANFIDFKKSIINELLGN
jgi:hypothetical protein